MVKTSNNNTKRRGKSLLSLSSKRGGLKDEVNRSELRRQRPRLGSKEQGDEIDLNPSDDLLDYYHGILGCSKSALNEEELKGQYWKMANKVRLQRHKEKLKRRRSTACSTSLLPVCSCFM